jgi:hypothetical protein
LEGINVSETELEKYFVQNNSTEAEMLRLACLEFWIHSDIQTDSKSAIHIFNESSMDWKFACTRPKGHCIDT